MDIAWVLIRSPVGEKEHSACLGLHDGAMSGLESLTLKHGLCYELVWTRDGVDILGLVC